MRIAYCTNVRLPSERAHGHQVAQVCDALVHRGHDVTIFAPFRKNVVKQDYWKYYGANKKVKLTHVGRFDAIASWLTPGFIGLLTMNIMLRRRLRKILPAKKFDLLYTRSPALLRPLIKSKIPVILELHQLPRRGKGRFVKLCNRCKRIACLTSAMRDILIAWGVNRKLVIAEGDAVDLTRFKNLPSRTAAQKKFSLTTDRLVVGYVGRLKTLGMDKGVAVLLQALKELRLQKKFFGFIVGGPASDEKEYVKMAAKLGLDSHDVVFTGEIPAADVPMSLAACDVLAMPFPDKPHYRHHMSPLKMFEYMAAGRPLLTSDLPTVRDVLDESTAVFCKAGDVKSLVKALHWIAGHPKEAADRAKRAKELVKKHSWEERMERILSPSPRGRRLG
ncbi:glycosyltransferase family 4 protein [Candidatus Uhrbacteria bacterium]|nr:glycosyltransferase family 4 protein [Candidatus Uhrbacteria bacterium]